MFARSLFRSLARSFFHMQRHTHADTHRRTQIDAGTHRQSRTHSHTHTHMHTHTQGVFCGGITVPPQGRGGERGLCVDTCGKFSRKRTVRPSTCAPTIGANLSLLPYCGHTQPKIVETTRLGCRRGQVMCVAVCCSVLQCVAVCCSVILSYANIYIYRCNGDLILHSQIPLRRPRLSSRRGQVILNIHTHAHAHVRGRERERAHKHTHTQTHGGGLA